MPPRNETDKRLSTYEAVASHSETHPVLGKLAGMAAGYRRRTNDHFDRMDARTDQLVAGMDAASDAFVQRHQEGLVERVDALKASRAEVPIANQPTSTTHE